jgi:hypothetical protein
VAQSQHATPERAPPIILNPTLTAAERSCMANCEERRDAGWEGVQGSFSR